MKQRESSKAELYGLAAIGLARGLVNEGLYDVKRFIEKHRQNTKAGLGQTALQLTEAPSVGSLRLVEAVHQPLEAPQAGLESVINVDFTADRGGDKPLAA